jgi:hypothetical protein
MHSNIYNKNRPEALLNARRSELKINEVKDATLNEGILNKLESEE